MVAAALVLIVLSAPGCGGEEAVAVPEAVAGQVTTIDSAQGKALDRILDKIAN